MVDDLRVDASDLLEDWPISPELILVSPPEIAARARSLLPEPGSFGRVTPASVRPIGTVATVATAAPAAAAGQGRAARRVLVAVTALVVFAAGLGFGIGPTRDGTVAAPATAAQPASMDASRRAFVPPRTFAWMPKANVSSYVVTFSHDGKRVLTLHVRGSRVDLPKSFRFRGGDYRWRVVPVRPAASKPPAAIVDSTFVVAEPTAAT
jgi:hypothetical protein